MNVLGSRDDKDKTRQHILLSATLHERVEQLAALSLNNPVTVGLEEQTTPAQIMNSKVGTSKTTEALRDMNELDRHTGEVGPSDGYTE